MNIFLFGDFMKRISLSLCFILFFLCSCRSAVTVSFEEKEETLIFALEDCTNNIKEISMEYTIDDEQDLFYLYTIYQNYLPIGFSSPASPNVSLLKSCVNQHTVSYYVDNYIFLCDIPLFFEVLTKTGKQFGYKEIQIFFNDNKLI